jgi:hypothetical protein
VSSNRQGSVNLLLFSPKTALILMNTLFSFRRSALLVLLVAASLSACKKENSDAAPDLASRVAGSYNFSELVTGGKSYPASETNLKGTMNVTRQTATTVSIDVAIKLKSTNEFFIEDSADNVAVVDAGSGKVEYRLNGNVIATSNGNKLSISGEDDNGVDLTVSATK